MPVMIDLGGLGVVDRDKQLLALDRVDCEESLAEFVRQFWHVVEPMTPLLWGWSMDAICEHLEAVSYGEITRLLINVPPGSSKSLLCNVFWPAWEWTRVPHKRYLSFSYAAHLTERDNRRFLDVLRSARYQAMFGDRFTLKKKGEENVSNNKTGFKVATSIGGVGTGERGDCLLAGTIIETNQGQRPIENIVNAAIPVSVLSYDEHSKRVVYRSIQAVARRASEDFFRVHFAGGGMVECTGDHRFYTSRGYVQARFLSKNDVLLRSMRKACGEDSLRDEEGAQAWLSERCVRSSVRSDKDKYRPRKTGAVLQCLRRQDTGGAKTMLRRVCQDCQNSARRVEGSRKARSSVWDLQQDVYATGADGEGEFLLQGMQLHRSLSTNAGTGKSRLAKWDERAPLHKHFSATVQKNQGVYIGSRRTKVCRLQSQKGLVRTSHRYGPIAQCMAQLSDAMSPLSHRLARNGAFSVQKETVALVERVCEPAVVYDIQVEGTKCFFANGVLVHNCVLFDDPHSIKDNESDVIRKSTVEFFATAMSNRLNDMEKSAIVVIMQRVHEEDVSGYILEKDLGYEHLCIPAEFEPERRCSTSIGWEDPRTEVAETFWENRFPTHVLEAQRKIMGPFAFAGQYQQRPDPAGGGIIKRDWWQLWEESAFPPMDYILASLDTAYTEKTENDYSALTVWGVFTHDPTAKVARMLDQNGRPMSFGRSFEEPAPKLMLMHAWQDRLELHALVERVAAICRKMRVDTLMIENKAAGHSVAQEIRRLYGHEDWGVMLNDPKSQDKVSRLYSVQHIWADGMIYAPDRQWADMTISQVAQFPKGKHDDIVDTCSQAVRKLRDMGLLTRPSERLAEIEDAKSNWRQSPEIPYDGVR